MLRAIKVRIYPNEQQTTFIKQQLGCCRLVYNCSLDYKKSCPKASQTDVVNNILSLKQQFPFLKDVHSKVLQQSVRDLNTAYSNFFKHKQGYPNFKSKHDNKQSCRFPIDAFIGIKGNRISLIKALKHILFKCSVRDEKYLNKNQDKVRYITLTRTCSNKYYLSILIDGDLSRTMKQSDNAIGIDLGIKDFVITSTGEVFSNMHYKKKDINKIKRLQRLLSRKVVGSNNRNKARIKLARAYDRISNRKEWYIHNVVNRLLDENQIIVMEDLNVAGMKRNHNLAEAISEMNWGEFRRVLGYKSSWYGKEVIIINRYYPSSKRCNHCGYINKGLKLSDRQWICPQCGKVIERDYNAACNILDEGLRMLNEGIIGLSSPKYKPVDHPTAKRQSTQKCEVMDDQLGNKELKSSDGEKQERNEFHNFL